MQYQLGPLDDGVSIRVSAACCCYLLMLSVGGPDAIPGQHANRMFRDVEWTDDGWLSWGPDFLLAVNKKVGVCL